MSSGIVAIVVQPVGNENEFELVDVLSDASEIESFRRFQNQGIETPLEKIVEIRSKKAEEDEEFADYIEGLLVQPYVKPEIREHGLQWLKSKMRIEYFQKKESEAAKVISQYAFDIFKKNSENLEFVLSGPKANVTVIVFKVGNNDFSANRFSA